MYVNLYIEMMVEFFRPFLLPTVKVENLSELRGLRWKDFGYL